MRINPEIAHLSGQRKTALDDKAWKCLILILLYFSLPVNYLILICVCVFRYFYLHSAEKYEKRASNKGPPRQHFI